MKAKLLSIKPVLMLAIGFAIVSSCNKVEGPEATEQQKVSSADSREKIDEILLERRAKVTEKANSLGYRIGKRLGELAVEQEKAKQDVKETIETRIKMLQIRKQRIDQIMQELAASTIEGLKQYEEELNKFGEDLE